MARAFGAGKVITTCSAQNVEFCAETLKASQVIDYTTQKWWEILGANSIDVVYDCIGEAFLYCIYMPEIDRSLSDCR